MSGADPDLIAENQSQRTRLTAVTLRLDDDALARPLGGGWTISTALAHMAYWDRRAALILNRWTQGQVPPLDEPEWYSGDLLNESLLAEWQALAWRDAIRLAIEAAETVDSALERLDARLVTEIAARGEAWLLRRGVHRREHLDQIERGLGERRGGP
jgi:hypothetical protein